MECFLAQMRVQKGEILERLSSARNFSNMDDEENYCAANKAIKQVRKAEEEHPVPAGTLGRLQCIISALTAVELLKNLFSNGLVWGILSWAVSLAGLLHCFSPFVLTWFPGAFPRVLPGVTLSCSLAGAAPAEEAGHGVAGCAPCEGVLQGHGGPAEHSPGRDCHQDCCSGGTSHGGCWEQHLSPPETLPKMTF